MGLFNRHKGPASVDSNTSPDNKDRQVLGSDDAAPITATQKTKTQRLLPAFACGAGLYSDGFLQAAIGPVNTLLKLTYGAQYTQSTAAKNIASISFVGTVVGQLFFGYTSDHYSRKWSLMVSTIILFVFAALSAGAYGANGSASGLFAALTAYRFLVGIGIGGEYPAGSVACAEATGEIEEGKRNRYFILFTNTMIDLGFIFGSLVPTIVSAIAPDRYFTIWRVSLAIGALPPLIMLPFRWFLHEPESVSRNSFRGKNRTPYWLALKYYGPRLIVVSCIWFLYDFLSYSFGLYSSNFILTIIGKGAPLYQTFGWATVINCFYLPGALIGAYVSDWIGPKKALAIFVAAQGVIAFIMAGTLEYLQQARYVAAFVVVYGVFLALGEIGPGDNIGLIASKTSATGIRGQYYAIAAAVGKIGGFSGSYAIPVIQADAGSNELYSLQLPFYVAGALCFVTALLVFLLPKIDQNSIDREDANFRAYLDQHGWDTSHMGTEDYQSAHDSVTIQQEKQVVN